MSSLATNKQPATLQNVSSKPRIQNKEPKTKLKTSILYHELSLHLVIQSFANNRWNTDKITSITIISNQKFFLNLLTDVSLQ